MRRRMRHVRLSSDGRSETSQGALGDNRNDPADGGHWVFALQLVSFFLRRLRWHGFNYLSRPEVLHLELELKEPFNPAFSLLNQVQTYVSQTTQADPHALFVLFGGANNLQDVIPRAASDPTMRRR
jgi:hypothetical protein